MHHYLRTGVLLDFRIGYPGPGALYEEFNPLVLLVGLYSLCQLIGHTMWLGSRFVL